MKIKMETKETVFSADEFGLNRLSICANDSTANSIIVNNNKYFYSYQLLII
jgi:hypothetical protein